MTLYISLIYSKIISPCCIKAIFCIIVFLSIPSFLFANTDINQLQKLVASDRGSSDQFGSVSIDGNYAIVGSPFEDHDANGLNFISNAGSAYIFVKNGKTWTQQQKIVAPDRGSGDNFGSSVSISGDYIVIGAHLEDHDANGLNNLADAGSAYVFVRNGNTWDFQQKLVASDRASGDYFGVVSISGNYILIGARLESEDELGINTMTGAGSAYIFERSGSIWTQQQKLVASDRSSGDWFGYKVSINANTAVISAPNDAEDANGNNFLSLAGSVYVFVRSGSTWTQQQKIVASVRASSDYFGFSVSINGEYIIVGVREEDQDANNLNTKTDAGSAYIFIRNGTTWTQQQKIVASDRNAGDNFGHGVSISGEYAIVSAWNEDEDASGGNTFADAGSAYIFKREGSIWTEVKKIVASDRNTSDQFGSSVSLNGNIAFVGANLEDEDINGSNTLSSSGSVYVYYIAEIPTFTTSNANSISALSAMSGGVITSSGTNPILQRGIVWDVNPNPTIALSTITSDGSGNGTYFSQITNLVQITTYYVRAYVTTLYGTYYGNEISFTTPFKIELDGNQDGILDSTQDHVHTFYDPTGTKLITIIDLNSYRLSEVSSSYSNESTYNYPYGLINFKVHASQTQVRIYFHATTSLVGYDYRKLFSDNRIRNYDYAVFGSEVIGGNTVATVTLTLVDGGIGDSDGIVNGVITDPGGPAIAIVNANIPTLSEWARIFLISLLVVFGVWKLRKYV